jgi:DNA-binding transcriptional MerR regulator
MPEFLLSELFAAKLEISPNDLPRFEAQGIIRPVSKNGHTYYSSRDFYQLKGILHFMRNEGLSVEDAQERVTHHKWEVAIAAPAT